MEAPHQFFKGPIFSRKTLASGGRENIFFEPYSLKKEVKKYFPDCDK
jgi:hypothetical protein